ncbi:hypothetical protein N7478_002026 [Penicillium angulare]|uniref:uncharacterized protein n=1 Tax=Penicillium angulare TaxID=116970 RepID=UPI002541532D|nr:uncharacterized protein N7478_002026 [Penicillium angulare]KAJ5288996.1 hypothetical protein N7478_002026 [Penicillium angulare]
MISLVYEKSDSGPSSSKGFRLVTDNGTQFFLAPKYLNEIRSNQSLRFEPVVKKLRVRLTLITGNIVDPMIQIADSVVRNTFTDNKGMENHTNFDFKFNYSITSTLANKYKTVWHEISLTDPILNIVACLSSQVFVGKELSQNPEWIENILQYTVDASDASEALHLVPKNLRPFAAHFSPAVRRLRKRVVKTRTLFHSVLDKTRIQGEKSVQENLGIMSWFEECSKGRTYDPAATHLNLAFVSISSTSDMITQLIYDLCGREELVTELRDEIISVLGEEGWSKKGLYKLQLLDSVMKESQRLKPGIVGLQRYAEKDTVLSEGTFIPKGSFLIVSCHHMFTQNFGTYDNAGEFDGHRFYNIRQSGAQEQWTQFAAASEKHVGFGYGQHACPGRFFATNQIKIIMCHFLLNYDFNFVDGLPRKPCPRGIGLQANPSAMISIRRRQSKVDL